jgi:VanZ family protein
MTLEDAAEEYVQRVFPAKDTEYRDHILDAYEAFVGGARWQAQKQDD